MTSGPGAALSPSRIEASPPRASSATTRPGSWAAWLRPWRSGPRASRHGSGAVSRPCRSCEGSVTGPRGSVAARERVKRASAPTRDLRPWYLETVPAPSRSPDPAAAKAESESHHGKRTCRSHSCFRTRGVQASERRQACGQGSHQGVRPAAREGLDGRDARPRRSLRPSLCDLGTVMTASLLPLGLVIAFGSALTLRLLAEPGIRSGAGNPPPARSETNRAIERRLDRAVNGPPADCVTTPRPLDPLLFPHASRSVLQPQPCSSPEPWRRKP